MPFFDFKCQSCDKIHEAFLSCYDAPPPVCPFCGVITRRIYSVAWSSGDKPMCLPGTSCNDPKSDRYANPDNPNPARRWYQEALRNQDAEDRGTMPKMDDHVDLAIEAWRRDGHDL